MPTARTGHSVRRLLEAWHLASVHRGVRMPIPWETARLLLREQPSLNGPSGEVLYLEPVRVARQP